MLKASITCVEFTHLIGCIVCGVASVGQASALSELSFWGLLYGLSGVDVGVRRQFEADDGDGDFSWEAEDVNQFPGTPVGSVVKMTCDGERG